MYFAPVTVVLGLTACPCAVTDGTALESAELVVGCPVGRSIGFANALEIRATANYDKGQQSAELNDFIQRETQIGFEVWLRVVW